jgi:cytochrome c556
MRIRFATAMCTLVLGLIASSSFSAAQQKTADRPIHFTIKDLMESIIDPSADVIWGAAGTVADKQGVRDLSPKTPEDWLEVRRAAVRLIEGGNLLMMPGREAAPAGVKSEAPGVELEPAEITVLIRKEREGFDAFALALQAVGAEALRAIEAKNTDLLIEAGGHMEEVCESCHQTFWYPQARAAAPN